MNNTQLTKEIIAIILEEVNGYTQEAATQLSQEYNGELEDRIYKLLKEQRLKPLTI